MIRRQPCEHLVGKCPRWVDQPWNENELGGFQVSGRCIIQNTFSAKKEKLPQFKMAPLPHIKKPGGRKGRVLRLINWANQHHLGPDYSLLSAQPRSWGEFLQDDKMDVKAPIPYNFLILGVQRKKAILPFSEQGSPSLESTQISLCISYLTKFHPILIPQLVCSKRNEWLRLV